MTIIHNREGRSVTDNAGGVIITCVFLMAMAFAIKSCNDAEAVRYQEQGQTDRFRIEKEFEAKKQVKQ